MKNPRAALSAICVLLTVAPLCPAGAIFETIATEQTPYDWPGETVGRFSEATIGSTGSVAWYGNSYVAPESYLGFWRWHEGEIDLALAGGQPAPGAPEGHRFTAAHVTPYIGPAGRLYTRAYTRLNGDDGNPRMEGLYRQTEAGAVHAIEAEQTPIDGDQAGRTCVQIDLHSAGWNGEMLYNVWGPDRERMLAVSAPGQPTQIVFEYGVTSPPGFAPDTAFSTSSISPRLNASGMYTFGASVLDAPHERDEGLWRGNAFTGALDLVLEEGETAEGLEPGEYLRSFEQSRLNTAGDMALRAEFGLPSDPYAGDGLVAARGNTAELVVRSGDPAPGCDGDVRFDIRRTHALPGLNALQINDIAEILFYSGLVGEDVTDDTRAGLWLNRPGGDVEMVLREGQLAPALDDGATINRILTAHLTDSGRIVIEVSLDDVSFRANRLIYLRQPDGSMDVLLREGDPFETPEGEMVMAGRWEEILRVNDDEQFALAFGARGEPEALYRVTVPEPASLGLLGSLAVVVLRRRR
jgi:hypothetical protein